MEMIKKSSPVSPLFLFFLFIYSTTTSYVSSQSTDSCSSKLSVSNLIPFNTSGLSCFSPWSSEDFILRFGMTGTNVWSFVLSAPDTGSYVSIGFSPNGNMVGSSAMAGWISSAGTGTVKQYYLGGKSSSSCPPDQGSLSLVQGKSLIVSQNSRIFLAFQLSGQPLQNVIYAVGGLPSSAGGYLPQHRSVASSTFNASGGGGNNNGGGDGENDDKNESENKQREKEGGGGGGDRAPTAAPTGATTTTASAATTTAVRRGGVLGFSLILTAFIGMLKVLRTR